MSKKISDAFEAVIKKLDEVSDPKELTKREYHDLLEELAGNLEGRIEAVVEELVAETPAKMAKKGAKK